MPEIAVRTLVAPLADPTAHKAQKLKSLLQTYRSALTDAFTSGAETMSAVNDIVTPYDLPYQAKDALKSYVPKLRSVYGAREIHDAHPLRLVNRAARFDYSDSRTHSYCWEVPQPGRGTNFWIPLQINPAQAEYWSDLVNETVSAGELRVQKDAAGWTLHVDIKTKLPEVKLPDDGTLVGFDVGETALLTGCAVVNDRPVRPFLVDGGRAKRLRKEAHTTRKRLQRRDASSWRLAERRNYYQNALTDIIEQTSRCAVSYASEFEEPIIVLEDLGGIGAHREYGSYMNRRLNSWAFARLQGRIEDKAAEDGIPVVFVPPEYTSQACHCCHGLGARPNQGTFKCRNSGCHISEFQADINAAVNIARRARPWGESCSWKPNSDDSP